MKQSIIITSVLAAILACLPACNSNTEQPASELAAQKEPAAPVQQAPQADPDSLLEIVIHHPGANQKNKFYSYAKYGDAYSANGKTPLPDEMQSAISALKAAVQADLIESDAFYSCRGVKNGRQIRIRFKENGHEYSATSASNCANFAPFNVVVDNKRFVQLNGQTAKALKALLQNDFDALTTHVQPGFINFNEAESEALDDIKAAPQNALIDHYSQIVLKDEAITKLLESRKLKQDLPEFAPTLLLGCNQRTDESCNKLAGALKIPVSEKTEYSLSIKFEGEAFSADLPPSFEPAKRAIEQPAVRAFIESVEAPIVISWAPSKSCALTDALLPWFKLEKKGDDCDKWFFANKAGDTRIIYYPTLDATWISDDQNSRDAALKPLLNHKSLPKPTRAFIQTADKQAKNPRNIFIDGNSNLYLFETKNKKTTCTSCK